MRKCFARTYHGCGLQSLVSEKRERERRERVCLISHPCEHRRKHKTVNMSQLAPVCACVRLQAWASSLAGSPMAVCMFKKKEDFSPAFSVHADASERVRELYNST